MFYLWDFMWIKLHLECISSSKTYYAMRCSYLLGNSAYRCFVSTSSGCSVVFGVKKTWIPSVLLIIEYPRAKENPLQARPELIDISVNHKGHKALQTKVRKQPVMAIGKHQWFPRWVLQQHVLMKVMNVTKELKAQASIMCVSQIQCEVLIIEFFTQDKVHNYFTCFNKCSKLTEQELQRIKPKKFNHDCLHSFQNVRKTLLTFPKTNSFVRIV